jgi:mono/diheme cytochrome c family protein
VKRRLRHVGALGLCLGVLMAATGCRRGTVAVQTDPLIEVFRKQAEEEGLSRLETDGKRLFAQYCVTCHGDNGAGNGQNASTLDPRPPDFRTSLSAHPPAYWKQIIEGGSIAVGRSPLCPPRGRTLTSDDVAALVAYLGILSRPAAQRPAPVGPASKAPAP